MGSRGQPLAEAASSDERPKALLDLLGSPALPSEILESYENMRPSQSLYSENYSEITQGATGRSGDSYGVTPAPPTASSVDLATIANDMINESLGRTPAGTSVVEPDSIIGESGRLYHGYKEGSYYLPNDAAEQDRLDLQHEMFRILFDGYLALAPLSSPPKNVLDIGTGTGIWAVEFGMDLSAIQPPPRVPNVTFVKDDSEAPWVFPDTNADPSFDGHQQWILFDYVHLRLTFTCWNDARNVMRNAFNNMTSGGWIEFHENVFEFFQANSDATMRWADTINRGAEALGRDIRVLKHYEAWLKEVGFVNITVRHFILPTSPWPQNEKLARVGEYNMRNIYDGARGISWKMLAAAGMSSEEIDVIIDELKQELTDKRSAVFSQVSDPLYGLWVCSGHVQPAHPVNNITLLTPFHDWAGLNAILSFRYSTAASPHVSFYSRKRAKSGILIKRICASHPKTKVIGSMATKEYPTFAAHGGSGDVQSDVVRLDDEVLAKMAQAVDNFEDITREAQFSTEFERKMSLREAIRMYPKAVAFSMILSLSLIMEGYDTSLLGSYFAYPEFQKKFGIPLPDGTYQLTAEWQSGLQNAVQVGEIIGLYLAGIIAERYGYRWTMLGAMVLMTGVIFIMFFAQNISMLMAGEILCGLPWGAFQTLTTTYAAEISPMILRPYLTTYVNMCWVIGQLISAGLVRGLLSRSDEWGWRIPYAVQWVWVIPIIIGVLLAPESPWWLVRNDRIEDAKKVLQSLVSSKNTDYDVDRNIAMIIHTNAQERAISAGTSYKDCFKGTDLRRTEITCVVWIIQITCGIWFGGNVTYFLQQAGFSNEKSFDFGLGHNAIGVVGTLLSWWVMQYVGRRTLYLWGLVIMLVILIVIGFMGIPEPSDAIAYASGTLLMIFTLTFDITVGPVCYCLVSEIPSTRLRIKTVALARNCYNIASIVANFLNNPILNPTAWNLRGKGGFVWCGFSFLSLVWAYYRLPEPKGRSAGELDVLFEQNVKARDFSKVHPDPFRSNTLKVVPEAEAKLE
ncbi:hypothetical protein BX600DRAFT_438768 [Xylariales sp. PMI_506]|nr:hypothetical protein BX600DRAFT_438768 [Xylariales sp. PMI_506]